MAEPWAVLLSQTPGLEIVEDLLDVIFRDF